MVTGVQTCALPISLQELSESISWREGVIQSSETRWSMGMSFSFGLSWPISLKDVGGPNEPITL
jgi:hypothetical protein